MKKKIVASLVSACLLLSPTMALAAENQTGNEKVILLAALSKTDMIKQLQQNAAKVQSVKSMRVNGQFSIKLDAPTASKGFLNNTFSKIKGAINNTSGTFQTSFQAPGRMYSKVAVNYTNGKQTKEPISIENYYVDDKQYIKLPLVPGKYSWVQRQPMKNAVIEAVKNIPMTLQPSLLKNLSMVYKGNGQFAYNGSISSSDAMSLLAGVGVPKEIRSLFQTVSGSIVMSGNLSVDPKTFLTKGTSFTISLVPKDSKVFKKLSVFQNLTVSGYNSTTVTLPTEAVNAKTIPFVPLPF